METLPIEIFEEITCLLTTDELKAATLTCRIWRDIIHSAIFPRRLQLVIRDKHPVTYQDLDVKSILQFHASSMVVKKHVQLIRCPMVYELVEFFKVNGPTLKSLVIEDMDLISEMFDNVVNLEYLEIARGRLKTAYVTKIPIVIMPDLHSLNLAYCNLECLTFFLLRPINLVRLTIESLNIEDNEEYLVKDVIDRNAKTLKEISLHAHYIPDFLLIAVETFEELKLTKLNFESINYNTINYQIQEEAFAKIIGHQKSLKMLRIYYYPLPDELAMLIFSELPEIRSLRVVVNSMPLNTVLVGMNYLEMLDVVFAMSQPWDPNIDVPNLSNIRLTVGEITYFGVNFFANMCQCLPNLTTFSLNCHRTIEEECDITWSLAMNMVKYCPMLRRLDLRNCLIMGLQPLLYKLQGLVMLESFHIDCFHLLRLDVFDFPSLIELHLINCRTLLTQDMLDMLVASCPLIEVLQLHLFINPTPPYSWVTTSDLWWETIFKGFKNLNVLSLCICAKDVSSNFVKIISENALLREFDLRISKVENQEFSINLEPFYAMKSLRNFTFALETLRDVTPVVDNVFIFEVV